MNFPPDSRTVVERECFAPSYYAQGNFLAASSLFCQSLIYDLKLYSFADFLWQSTLSEPSTSFIECLQHWTGEQFCY